MSVKLQYHYRNRVKKRAFHRRRVPTPEETHALLCESASLMASNEGKERQHPATNGQRFASSNFAVHLAPHLASQGSQTYQLTRETFSQLHQELLGGRCSQLRLDDSITDVNKLICIVLKAGLEPRSEEDGNNNEGFQRQVLDCLDIIQAAVEKAPQSLVEISDPGVVDRDVHAPLFAWLVVRLIDLSVTLDSEIVQERAGEIFSKIVYSQYKQVRPWPYCLSISTFLRICTEGL